MRNVRRGTGRPRIGPGQVVVDLATLVAFVVVNYERAEFLLELARIVRDVVLTAFGK